mmetsp:Transcript_11399/g.19156  ORF Transcript_11399/g.19156 Transcript_11399/m.19156 type:complete len:205 (+) Transcript_11399:786-1400(+)
MSLRLFVETSITCSWVMLASAAGSSLNWLEAASRLRSLLSDTISEGNELKALFEMIRVVKSRSWPTCIGRTVSALSAISSRNSLRHTQFQTAGSTGPPFPDGNAGLLRSDSSRRVSFSTMSTSGHTGSGAAASWACSASAASTLALCTSSCLFVCGTVASFCEALNTLAFCLSSTSSSSSSSSTTGAVGLSRKATTFSCLRSIA